MGYVQTEARPISELDSVIETLTEAGAHPDLVHTLRHGLDPQAIKPAVARGNDIFNTYSLACALLREQPGRALAEQPAEPSEQHSQIGSLLLRLVNDSVTRDAHRNYNFNFTEKRKGLDACSMSEEGFMRSLGHVSSGHLCVTDRDMPHELYCDDSGKPVFFKKGWEIPTGLSMQDVTLNGVAYPRGTIFQIIRDKNTDERPYLNGAKTLRTQSLDDITGLAPIRASSFMFEPENRLEIMRASLLNPDEKIMDLEELFKHLPHATTHES